MLHFNTRLNLVNKCLAYWQNYYREKKSLANLTGGEMLEYLAINHYLNEEKIIEDFEKEK